MVFIIPGWHSILCHLKQGRIRHTIFILPHYMGFVNRFFNKSMQIADYLPALFCFSVYFTESGGAGTAVPQNIHIQNQKGITDNERNSIISHN